MAADAFFTLDGSAGSYLSTPHTANLEFTAAWQVQASVSVADVLDPVGFRVLYSNRSAVGNGEDLLWAWDTATQKMRASTRDQSAIQDQVSDPFVVANDERHSYLAEADSSGWTYRLDFGLVSSHVFAFSMPFVPNTDHEVRIGGSHLGGAPWKGNVWTVFVAAGVGPDLDDLLNFDAGNASLPNGPVSDGSTFSSGGRVWTVHGDGVSFTNAIQDFDGNFQLEATADIEFDGTFTAVFDGSFGLEATAETQFDGVHLPPASGDFGLVGEADLTLDGTVFFTGDFGLEVESLLEFDGDGWVERDFALVGSAELGFTGQAEMEGTFALEGQAHTRMEWVPFLCPGTSAVGCAVGPASVTDTLHPAEACTCQREGC